MTMIAAQRRCWLLAEALKFAPFKEALEIAQKAEAFLSGINDRASMPFEGKNKDAPSSVTTTMMERRAIRHLH